MAAWVSGRQNMLESFSVRGVSVSVKVWWGGFCLELSPLEFWGWVLWRLGVFGAGYPATQRPSCKVLVTSFPQLLQGPSRGIWFTLYESKAWGLTLWGCLNMGHTLKLLV